MHAYRVGQRVRATSRRGVGVIRRHHPTLPAWVVEFAGDTYPIAWTDDRLKAVVS